MDLLARCICGNGEAEEDRGAVLRCSVHGFEARTQQALRVAAEVIPCPNCAGAVEAERERIVALIRREASETFDMSLDHELRTLADRIAAGGQ